MANYIVTTDADELDPGATVAMPGGSGLSLREAITIANANAGMDTITFANGAGEAFENGGTILLTMGELSNTGVVTIDGDIDNDGTPDTTIDAQMNSRILDTSAGTTLRGLVLTGGKTTANGENGGAVRATGSANLVIEDSMVSGNSTAGEYASGGGIGTSSGNVTVTNSTVSGNSTAGEYARGGGIGASFGNVTLTNSTVSGNSTAMDYGGGGGIGTSSGNVTVTNSTVSGNSTAGEYARGGGIGTSSGNVTVTNSTVSGNSTAGEYARGGGTHAFSGDITLINSITIGNVTTYNGVDGEQIDGSTVNTSGLSIIGGNATLIFAQTAEVLDGNGIATGVQAGVLADNGGPVQTIALLADPANPALDAGDDGLAPAMDARGLARLDLPGIAIMARTHPTSARSKSKVQSTSRQPHRRRTMSRPMRTRRHLRYRSAHPMRMATFWLTAWCPGTNRSWVL